MRKFYVWPHGHEGAGLAPGYETELTPLSFEEWRALDQWSNADDLSWSAWLYRNGFTDPQDLRDSVLKAAVFVVRAGEPTIWFNPSGHEGAWIPLSEVERMTAERLAKRGKGWASGDDLERLVKYYKPDYDPNSET